MHIGMNDVVTDGYIGSTELTKMYKGSTLMWEKIITVLSPLRNVLVGDDLGILTLYFNFPNDLYLTLPRDSDLALLPEAEVLETINVITANGVTVRGLYDDSEDYGMVFASQEYNNPDSFPVWQWYSGAVGNMSVPYVPYSAAVPILVDSINTNNSAYQYIKVLSDGFRKIKWGDDLSGKRIYFELIDNFYAMIPSGLDTPVLSTTNNTIYTYNDDDHNAMIHDDVSTVYYDYDLSTSSLLTNIKSVVFHDGVQFVTEIDPSNYCLECMFIKDDHLKLIKESDDLAGKTIQLNFPDNLAELLNATGNNSYYAIEGNEGADYVRMQLDYGTTGTPAKKYCFISLQTLTTTYELYGQVEGALPMINESSVVVPADAKKITSVDDSLVPYFCMRIGEENLRDVLVGDDLSGATLYCSFPEEYMGCINDVQVIQCGTDNYITHHYESAMGMLEYIKVYYNGVEAKTLYVNDDYNVWINSSEYTLPKDFGSVTSITNTDAIYPYIKIR